MKLFIVTGKYMGLILLFALEFLKVYSQGTATIDSLQKILASEHNDTARAQLLAAIGEEYYFLKKDSSLWYFQKADDISVKRKDTLQSIHVRQRIAGIYNTTGNYVQALQLSFECLKTEQQLHLTNEIFFTKREIMWAYEGIGDYRKELELAKELLALVNSGYFKETKYLDMYRQILYNNFAGIYRNLGQLDSNLHYSILNYQFAQKSENETPLALASRGLADVYNRINQFDSSFYYSRLAIVSASKAKRWDLIPDLWMNIASLFQKKEQQDSAFYYSYKSLQQYKNLADTNGIADAAFFISDLYKSRKKYDSAYTYLSYYTSLQDKIDVNEKASKIQNITFSETLHQQQLEQEKKDAEQQYETKFKVYSLLTGLGVMLLLAFILYRNNKQKQKANNKIEKAYNELQSTQSQLIQAEKMASLGELTAGIAHEIQNPLNFVNNFSEVNKEMLEELKAERLKPKGERDKQTEDEIINDVITNEEKINHHGKRADAIVKGMLQHSRKNTGVKEPTDINALCDEYLRLSYHGLRAKDKSFNALFKTDFDESIGKINIIPQDIGRVLLNLFNNAFYAVNEKKKLSVISYQPSVFIQTKKINNTVEMIVKDNGSGIPQHIIDKIFQPFFTTKPTGEGTGLGLSLSYDIIKAHGGTINAESKEGKGSEFVIRLPLN